ncbi:hypothetical protein BDK51DRAFT_25774, partial [Blyttiomyces helicus]
MSRLSLVTIFAVFLATLSSVSAYGIFFDSPTTATSWAPGLTVTLTWSIVVEGTSFNGSQTDPLVFVFEDLRNGPTTGQPLSTFGQAAASDLNLTGTIPTTLQPGPAYSFRVNDAANTLTNAFVFSPSFAIAGGNATTTGTASTTASTRAATTSAVVVRTTAAAAHTTAAGAGPIMSMPPSGMAPATSTAAIAAASATAAAGSAG